MATRYFYGRPALSSFASAFLSLAVLSVFLALPPVAKAQGLPIYDMHLHYYDYSYEEIPPQRVTQLLEEAGVVGGLLSSTPNLGTWMLKPSLSESFISGFVPYRTHEDISLWSGDYQIVDFSQAGIAEHSYRAFGEFHLKPGQSASSVVADLATLAGRQGLFLHPHSDEVALEELISLAPDAPVLWAHAGLTTPPETVAEILERYPQVSADLSYRSGDIAPDGELDPAWRDLFLRYPDRFMVGTDPWLNWRWESYVFIVSVIRNYLDLLPEEVAVALAYGNAERWLKATAPTQR